MRANFILSEVATGLRRNLTMTIAMIITTAISLGLLGAGLLIARQISEMREIYYDKIQVSIFLTQDATDDQRTAIQDKLDDLKSDGEVESYLYETKEQAYERFQLQFRAQPEFVQNTKPDALPESFRVRLVNPERYDVVNEAFTTDLAENGTPIYLAGVDNVKDEGDFLDRLFDLLNGLRNATIALAVVGSLAALLLISNTIQLAAFTRRTETGIMRLVGASRWYTQLPFILEAAVAGLIGAMVAWGGLALAKWQFVDTALAGPIKSGILPPIDWSTINLYAAPLLGAAGVVLAALTAAVTLRLYVRL